MIRLGILGTARIANAFLGAPLADVEVLAIASREKAKADAIADAHGIPRRYGSYEALLADPDIDAVYIPLPQHLHAEYTVKSASAGKHVLVEKPAALSTSELRTMLAACTEHRVFFMEALMYRFKKIHRRVKEIVASGTLGELRYIDFNWCFNIRVLVRSQFRLEKKFGGGALYDLGVYGVDFLRFITGGEPVLRSAHVHRDEQDGVDLFSHASYTIGGVFATVTCGYTSDANYYTVSGTRGSVHVPGSVSGRVVQNLLQVHLIEGDTRYEEVFSPENPYRMELEYFAGCIERHEEPSPGFENCLRNIALIEGIFHQGIGI